MSRTRNTIFIRILSRATLEILTFETGAVYTAHRCVRRALFTHFGVSGVRPDGVVLFIFSNKRKKLFRVLVFAQVRQEVICLMITRYRHRPRKISENYAIKQNILVFFLCFFFEVGKDKMGNLGIEIASRRRPRAARFISIANTECR